MIELGQVRLLVHTFPIIIITLAPIQKCTGARVKAYLKKLKCNILLFYH